MSNYHIPLGEHVFIAGGTGTGKSFMVQNYLAHYPHVVALDVKGLLDWPALGYDLKKHKYPPKESGILLVDQLKDLPAAGQQSGKIIYRPRWEELNEEYYNLFFQWIYNRQNCIAWVDEVMGICKGPQDIPEYYKAILTRGRARNTSVWSVTQRPKTIPLVTISEASHIFTFRLNLEEDRERIAKVTGWPEFYQKPKRFEFWYYNMARDGAEPILAKMVRK